MPNRRGLAAPPGTCSAVVPQMVEDYVEQMRSAILAAMADSTSPTWYSEHLLLVTDQSDATRRSWAWITCRYPSCRCDRASMPFPAAPAVHADGVPYPEWFNAFLADRAIRKPSPHTAKAYRQDFESIGTLLCGDQATVGELQPTDLSKENLCAVFAMYAEHHAAETIRRCWSTWNTHAWLSTGASARHTHDPAVKPSFCN
jgi:hypothetical protein